MKKLLIFMIVVYFVAIVSASGVSPAYYSVNFGDNQSEFVFNFDVSGRAELYVSGDLSDYVALNKNYLENGGEVIVTLSLPGKLSSGLHRIRIGAKEIGGEGGIGLVSDVGAIIKLNVPYEGEYVETGLVVENADVNEETQARLVVYNKGEVDVEVNPILMYNGEIDMGSKIIKPYESEEFVMNFLVGSESGEKYVKAIVNYNGKSTETGNNFSIGKFEVGIINYSKNLKEDKLNKFKIYIKSLSSHEIKDVYANVSIINSNVSFLTPYENLGIFGSVVLEGFFETGGLNTREKANVTIFYGNETFSKVVRITIGEDYLVYWIAGILIVLALAIIIIILILKRPRKVQRKKK